MTSITFRNTPDKYRIAIGGHAGWDVAGKDIVCAAISVLIYTLLNAIQDFTYSFDKSSANVMVTADKNEHNRHAIDTVMVGLWEVSRQFPDNLTIDGDNGR